MIPKRHPGTRVATLDFLSCHVLAAEPFVGGWQSGPRSRIPVSNGALVELFRPDPELNDHSSAQARVGYHWGDRRITRADQDERHRLSAGRPLPATAGIDEKGNRQSEAGRSAPRDCGDRPETPPARLIRIKGSPHQRGDRPRRPDTPAGRRIEDGLDLED